MHARRSPYAILYRAFVVRPGCFSISQLPHGNAYLIGKEKRSWIEYFFAAAANILLGVTRLFYMKCGDGTEILQDFRICTSKKAAITKKVYRPV